MDRSRRVKGAVLLVSLLVLLVLATIANLAFGAFDVPPGHAIAVVLDHLGLPVGASVSPAEDAVVWQIRVPRTLLGILVGGGLGVAGASLQAVFRNPLAEPSVIGVSSGAAVGAIAGIVAGATFLGTRTVPALAFVGALIAVLAVYATARGYGRTEVVTLVLTGIAVSVIASAATGVMTYFADDDQLRGIIFWTLGSLSGATWSVVGAVAPIIGIGIVGLVCCSRSLNLLTLGDRGATHLGVNVPRIRLFVIVLAALVTGAGVAVAGIIGFVGLVVPHVVRLLVGPDNRVLMPASALGGALLLVLADLVARTVVIPEELPLGVVTALIGGPFFLWLIRRTRQEQGAWA